MTSPSQAAVRAVGQYTLQCANEASATSLDSPFKLGPLDHLVFPFVPIENVLIYRKSPTTSRTELLPIDRLRQALPFLLDYYPHLTGRLQKDQKTNTFEITSLGRGVELHEARCDLRLEDLVPSTRASGELLLTDLPDNGTALTPPFHPTIEGVCRDPLLAIQHTRFACGGVALGIRLHHIVCDAGGYFQLVRDMAEIYRGMSTSLSPSLSRIPQIRSYLHDTSVLSAQERQEALDYKPVAFYTEDPTQPDIEEAATSNAPTETAWDDAENASKPPITGRVLRFTGGQLQELKRRATGPSAEDWVSTFEALCAYLYRRVYTARAQLLLSQGVPAAEVPKRLRRGFWASINMRDSTRLNLGDNYFPNAIQPTYSVFPHELLANGDLWMVARALHTLIRSVDVPEMQGTTRWIAAQPDKSRIRVGFTFADGNFTVSQWSRFKMYAGVDFDVDADGKPVYPVLVAPPFTEISRVDALAMILSTEEDLIEGSAPSAIDVNLTVTDPLWAILDQDEQFRGYYRNIYCQRPQVAASNWRSSVQTQQYAKQRQIKFSLIVTRALPRLLWRRQFIQSTAKKRHPPLLPTCVQTICIHGLKIKGGDGEQR